MSGREFTLNTYSKPTLPSVGFAERFTPRLPEKSPSSIPPKMSLEMRKNIREFITLMGKLHDGFQEPIVDAGCGFRTNFSEATAFCQKDRVSYIAFDHFGHEKVDPYPLDFVASVYNIPLSNDIAGTVLCTEMLEHVRHPDIALAEMVRVLRPDGTLIVTVPGKDVPQHEKPPFQYDYGRFTPESLELMLTQQGIVDIEISRRWFDDEGVIKEINLLVSGKKQPQTKASDTPLFMPS